MLESVCGDAWGARIHIFYRRIYILFANILFAPFDKIIRASIFLTKQFVQTPPPCVCVPHVAFFSICIRQTCDAVQSYFA